VGPAFAQGAQPDAQALQKWGAAKAVRYHLEGRGAAPTDTVVIDLDWDLQAHVVLGVPRIRNGAKSSLQVASVESGPGSRVRLTGGASAMELPMPSPMLLAFPPGPSM